jgi:hypothetical protein
MALHCAATLLLVPHDAGAETDAAGAAQAGGVGAVLVPPLPEGADVVEELQALADLHRGERVVVPLTSAQRTTALAHLGRAGGEAATGAGLLRLEVGDDGWVLVPAQW